MATERLYLIHRGTGFIALIAVLLSALVFGGVVPFVWSMLALLVTILFALFSMRGLIVGVSPFPSSPLLPAILYSVVLIACVLFASPWSFGPSYFDAGPTSAHPQATMTTVLRLGTYGMLFVLAAAAFNSPRSANYALRIIAIWSTAVAAFGFYAYLSGSNPILGDNDGGNVVRATFINRNHYATYAAFGVIANLGAYLGMLQGRTPDQALRRRARELIERFFGGAWVFALGAIICGAAMVATASRTGALSGMLGLLVFGIAWTGRGRKIGLIGYGIVAAALAFVIYSSATNLFDRLSTLDGQEDRFMVYPAVIEGITDRPFFGHGLGSFPDTFQAYLPLDAAWAGWTEAHNSYLENMFEMGIPLAVLFYLSIGLIVWRIFRATRTIRRDRVFSCVGLGCTATAGLHAAFDFSLQIPAVAGLYAIILGLSWAQSFSDTELRRHRTG